MPRDDIAICTHRKKAPELTGKRGKGRGGKEEKKGNKDTQFESQTNVSTMSTKKGKGLKVVSEGGKVSKEGKVYTRIL
jgi:hypothetical protein